MTEPTTQLILVIIGGLTLLSSFLSWITRQQLRINKLEIDSRLASMELRLQEKIGASYASWQAHNDLADRVSRLEMR